MCPIGHKQFPTFEAYCRERWNLSRPRSYELLNAAKAVLNVSAIAGIVPTTESQARPLTRLADAAEIGLQIGVSPIDENQPKETHLRPLKAVPEEERKAIWEEATRKAEEEHAKLTAQRVQEAVAEWKQRGQESQAESNERRKTIRELETQIDLLKNHHLATSGNALFPCLEQQKFKIIGVIRNYHGQY
jgi:hypothetical protein